MEFEYVSLIKIGKSKYNIVDKEKMTTKDSPFNDTYNKFLEEEINNMLDDTEMMLYKMGIYNIIVGHPVEMIFPLFISLQENGNGIKLVRIDKKWYKKTRDII